MSYIHIIVLFEIFIFLIALYFIMKIHMKNSRISIEKDFIDMYIESIEKESLKEISFGDFEGLTFDEIKDKYPKEFQDMIEKGYEYKYPNGESLIDSYNRVCIELDNIISNNDDRTILICSHGGTIRNIITYLISNSYKYHWNFKIDNGSVTILEVQDGFTVITAMNNTSFI